VYDYTFRSHYTPRNFVVDRLYINSIINLHTSLVSWWFRVNDHSESPRIIKTKKWATAIFTSYTLYRFDKIIM